MQMLNTGIGLKQRFTAEKAPARLQVQQPGEFGQSAGHLRFRRSCFGRRGRLAGFRSWRLAILDCSPAVGSCETNDFSLR